VDNNLFYINRNPSDFSKGWGWVELDVRLTEYFIAPVDFPHQRFDPITGEHLKLPSRGKKAVGKQFTLLMDRVRYQLEVQKELTNQAVLAWLRSWAPIDVTARKQEVLGSRTRQF
jgi:hypothetical protein